MSGSIFFETLRRRKWTLLYWILGVALMAVYIVVVIPDVKTITQYNNLLKTMPPVLLNLLGTDITALASPAGFLGYTLFGWLILVLATYGVIYGLDITANDEDSGRLDMLLSLPIPRWRIVLEKYLAYTVGVVLIVLATIATLLWGITSSPALASVNAGQVIMACVNFIPATLLVLAITALIATILRRRDAAVAVAALFVVASWLIDTIGRAAPSVDGLRAISFLKYYNGANVIVNGAVPLDMLGLLGVALIALLGTVWFFNRRDIGV